MSTYIKIIAFLCCLFAFEADAQYAFFPSSGTVTYERKFHVQNFLKRNYMNQREVNTWDKLMVDNAVKNGPLEVITHHMLKFNAGETLYETIKEEYPLSYRNVARFNPFLSDTKTVVNIKNKEFQKLLPFGDEMLLLADSLLRVKWKYTNEYRDIAGYKCRRANGIIQDSIYVVAFFTGQIPLAGGPELLHGLPGLILGISVPSMNTNLFATKVEFTAPVIPNKLTDNKNIAAESKAGLTEKLKNTVYNWLEEKEFKRQLQGIFF